MRARPVLCNEEKSRSTKPLVSLQRKRERETSPPRAEQKSHHPSARSREGDEGGRGAGEGGEERWKRKESKESGRSSRVSDPRMRLPISTSTTNTTPSSLSFLPPPFHRRRAKTHYMHRYARGSSWRAATIGRRRDTVPSVRASAPAREQSRAEALNGHQAGGRHPHLGILRGD